MKPHEEWMFKAGQDLESSKVLLQAANPLFDIAIYHTQQCAEKSLKAFMAYHGMEISKIHDLKSLLEKCINIDTSFDELYDDCIYLNPFSTLYRYPEGDLMPMNEEVESALESTLRIREFIISKIK